MAWASWIRGRAAGFAVLAATGCATWSPSTGVTEASVHRSTVRSLSFSPDGQTLAVGFNREGMVRFVDVTTGALRGERRGPPRAGYGDPSVAALAWTPDGATLVSGRNDALVLLWDARSMAARATLSGHGDAVVALAVSPDGRLLATGDGGGAVILWDLPSGAQRPERPAKKGAIAGLAFTGPRALAIGHSNSEVALWDIDRGSERMAVRTAGLYRLSIGPAGQLVTAGSRLEIWDLAAGRQRPPTTPDGAKNSQIVAVRPVGALAIGAIDYNGPVRLCDIEACSAVLPLDDRYVKTFSALAWSPDGRALAAGGNGPVVLLWDVATLAARPVFVDGIVDLPGRRSR